MPADNMIDSYAESYRVAEKTGKYYGTIIETDEGERVACIWGLGHRKFPWNPSSRELKGWGNVQEWLDAEQSCDGHWESQEDLDCALELVEALNRHQRRAPK